MLWRLGSGRLGGCFASGEVNQRILRPVHSKKENRVLVLFLTDLLWLDKVPWRLGNGRLGGCFAAGEVNPRILRPVRSKKENIILVLSLTDL